MRVETRTGTVISPLPARAFPVIFTWWRLPS